MPFSLRITDKEELQRPLANRDYRLQATLKGSLETGYILTIKPQTVWYALEDSWSPAEVRYQLKRALQGYIQKSITGLRSSKFLSGIATGEFDDRQMRHEFGRFGLQHIMAISGFHFSLLASILGFCLGLCLPKSSASWVLIVALTGYFLFLGWSASIMRAWVAVVIMLLASQLGRQASGINTLGLALIVLIVVDPLIILSIGFELSFLSTAAILFFYSGAELLLQKIWLKRPLTQVVTMDRFHQHALILLTFFRQAIALTLAVHLVALPMMLFTFQKFPLMGLIYNLFFPFLVSLSMMLLVLALLFDLCIPPLASLLHGVNSHLTAFLLNFTSNMPQSVDLVWQVNQLPKISSSPIYAYCSGLALW